MITEVGETQHRTEKPREIFDRLLQRIKYSQIMPTKIEMHRARFIGFLSHFAMLNNIKGENRARVFDLLSYFSRYMQWQSQPDNLVILCKFFSVYRPYKESDRIILYTVAWPNCRAGFATASMYCILSLFQNLVNLSVKKFFVIREST